MRKLPLFLMFGIMGSFLLPLISYAENFIVNPFTFDSITTGTNTFINRCQTKNPSVFATNIYTRVLGNSVPEWKGNLETIKYFVNSNGNIVNAQNTLTTYSSFNCSGAPLNTYFGNLHIGVGTKEEITDNFSDSSINLDTINSLRMNVRDANNSGFILGTWGVNLGGVNVPYSILSNDISGIFSGADVRGYMREIFGLIGENIVFILEILLITFIGLIGLHYGIKHIKKFLGKGGGIFTPPFI